MFSLKRKPRVKDAEAASETRATSGALDASGVIGQISAQASSIGREAAEVRGAVDDAQKTATTQAQALQALAVQVREVTLAQALISEHTCESVKAVASAGQAVQAVGSEVAAIVDTLRQVSEAASQITQIALQTRLVAFNASVEAKRAGEAGRGFGVVADAVKDLASKVESSSKDIKSTMSQLDTRIATLAREIQRGQGDRGDEASAVHIALRNVEKMVGRIDDAAAKSQQVCGSLDSSIGHIQGEMQRTAQLLGATLGRTEAFLRISEQMIEVVSDSGVETADTPYILAVQEAARQISKLLEDALRTQSIDAYDLFDERYVPIVGAEPAQQTTRFAELADRLFPQVQERVLSISDKVVACIAVDRNGYAACHNKRYNHAQRRGDVAWNTANCRNRRMFDDRTGLASARNERPFLLQTYRRDMGGGNFIVMKEAAAPITVDGRHWGGMRLSFKF